MAALKWSGPIVVTRPLPTLKKDIGYLPGSLEKKMAPWVAPVKRFLDPVWSRVRVIPFIHLRGLTLDKSFIIADEMQNATVEEMRTFLTRIGDDSRVFVTGDTEQTDLDERSGLSDLISRQLPSCFELVRLTEVKRGAVASAVVQMYAEPPTSPFL